MSLVSQRNLAGGELAPSLYSRVDTIKYQTGVKTGRNFIIQKSGGLANRPGSVFVGEVKDSTKNVRLVPFVFSIDQTYILEFGDLTMRVILDGSYVLETAVTITGISSASQGVVTATAHGFSDGDEVYISGVVGMTEINGLNVIVSDKTTNTFKMKYRDGAYVDTSSFTAYSSAGSAARYYTLTTPYDENEILEFQYVQSGDVVTIVHPSFFPQDLTRSAHDSWAIGNKSLVPAIGTVTNINFSDGASGSQIFNYSYKITAVSSDTFEEGYSGFSATITGAYEPTSSQPHSVTWDAVTGAAYYNVYVSRSGHVGFIGVATTNSFTNAGITPDFSKTPPVENTYLTSAEDQIRPACVGYCQQRLIFGNNSYYGGTDQPEEVLCSRTGLYSNFSTSVPLQSDDAIKFRMAGRQVNEIRHILDLNKLLVFTSSGEYAAEGSGGGAITPTDISLQQYSYNGSASVPSPVVIDSTAIYVQARGSLVRDLAFDYSVDGYRGNDLTVFSWHLFEGKTIVDWAYQKTPNSVLWVVMDDGTILSLTYIREHQIWGWTRHDMDGVVERVAAIPEGNEDAVYFVVKRTIADRSVRYIEKLNTRVIDDVKDMVFMDCTLSYDGRNLDTNFTVLISQLPGNGWEGLNALDLSSSSDLFTAADVGNQVQVTGPGGDLVILTIITYANAQEVCVTANKTIPEDMRSVYISDWTFAVNTLSGLRHLAGEDVSIIGDGFVVSSPNNSDVNTVTVSSDGQINLDACYGVIHVGIPYISDIETLSIDSPSGESLINKKMLVQQVYLHVEKTRGLFAGISEPAGTDPLEDLYEAKVRNEESYDSPVDLKTGVIDVNTNSEWNNNGRIFIRQVDPLPAYIAGISIGGLIPFTGG